MRFLRSPWSFLPASGIALCLAFVVESARADEVDALRKQVEEQTELIRRQSEALDQMADRLRALEDERSSAGNVAAGGEAAAPERSAAKPHAPGSGFGVAASEWGSLNIRLYTYVRYLNQRALDDTYTNAFGRTTDLDLRNDIQFNKVTIYFNGWAIDPRLRYLLYVWSANTSQGLSAQVVVAGNLQFQFSEYLRVGAGISSLPGVRSTAGNFPFWLGVDERLIADEFFRPSYTSGIWAAGSLVEGVDYQLMVGNNLSQLGIDAGQLNAGLATFSGELTWMPLGPYGKAFGDFEEHQRLATRLGVHFTYSAEDAQGQPDTEDFENVQIRFADGSVIFTPDLFGPGTQIRKANYQMLSIDAGLKYQGYALEGELYQRWITNIRGRGLEALDLGRFKDQGFQLQASAMLLPETLQAYVSGSKIFGGRYGGPWDARVGFNWFPFDSQSVRWNNEVIYAKDSPVGALSLPYLVGADGPIFLSNVELFF